MIEPPWLILARSFIGTRETPGAQHNNVIVQWWADIRASFRDDETPWCAGFVGAMLERSGIRSTRSAAARSYLNWGLPLYQPAVGAIVVFSRPPNPASGHVGFAIGKDQRGNILTLGGNQADVVSIAPFRADRVLSYRWPQSHIDLIDRQPSLPFIASTAPVSTREA